MDASAVCSEASESVLYIIYQVDRPGAEAVRAALRTEHFAYLDQHRDILVLGGAMLDEDGATRTGSVLIVNVRTWAEAEEFSVNEPFRRGGLFERVEINRMRRGQWNPAAAPKTEEGD